MNNVTVFTIDSEQLIEVNGAFTALLCHNLKEDVIFITCTSDEGSIIWDYKKNNTSSVLITTDKRVTLNVAIIHSF